MVTMHQKFDFEGKTLIEKVIIKAPFRYTVNFHDEACFIYFSTGKTIINSPNEQEEISHHESVLLKCGNYFADLARYGDADKFEILVFHLYPDLLRKIYRHEIPAFMKQPVNRSFIHKVNRTNSIKGFVESLNFYFGNPALMNEELLELKLKELILLLIQTNNAASIINLFADLFTVRDLSIREVVNNYLFRNIAIRELAQLCNMSESTFNRTFQNIFNDTPASYIKSKRLERARELLSFDSMSISEIASETCFNDVAHFSRSFKTLFGCSPSDYRLSLSKIQVS
jgi:AraC-like DNA-binding protein